MSLREYLAIWAISITFTAAVVGWAFLVQTFGLPDAATVILGAGVPLLLVAVVLGVVIVESAWSAVGRFYRREARRHLAAALRRRDLAIARTGLRYLWRSWRGA